MGKEEQHVPEWQKHPGVLEFEDLLDETLWNTNQPKENEDSGFELVSKDPMATVQQRESKENEKMAEIYRRVGEIQDTMFLEDRYAEFKDTPIEQITKSIVIIIGLMFSAVTGLAHWIGKRTIS